MDEQQNTQLGFDPSKFDQKSLDEQHNKYLDYLGENIGLQGEKGYAEARKHYLALNAERAKRQSIALQEQMQKDPSFAQQIGAIGRGFQEKGVDIVGALPDIGQAIANRLGMDEGESPFGSKNLSRSLQGLGSGYYTSERLPTAADSKPRILNPITQSILGVQPTSEPATLGDMPSKLRPYAVGGEELAIGVSFFAPQAIAARYKSIAPIPKPMEVGKGAAFKRAIDDQVQAYAKNPLFYSSLETGVASLQALGGGVAEKLAPGDPNLRMGLTLAPVPFAVGGGMALVSFLNAMSMEAIPRGAKAVSKVARMMIQGDKALEAELTKELEKYFTKLDANPSEAIKALTEVINKRSLTEGKLPGISTGLLTGNKELLAIESAIIKNIPDVTPKAAQEAKNAVVELNTAFNNLLKIENADPEIVRTIADARIAQINALFSAKANGVINQIKDLQKKIGLGSESVPRDKQRAAIQIREIILKNLKQLNDYETAQWNKLDRTLNAQTNETQRAISALIDKGVNVDPLIPDSLDKIKIVRDIGETTDPIKARGVDSGVLIDAKKDLSKKIDLANKSNNYEQAYYLGILQKGVYDDLGKLSKKFGAQVKIADAATKNKFDFLDIDIVSELLKKSGQGKYPKPDLILENKLLGKESLNYNTFNDLLIATRGQILSKEPANPLGKFYVAAADEAIDPQQGLVDADKLSAFMIKNREGLRALGMYDTLSEPVNQALFVKKLQQFHKDISKRPTQEILERITNSKNINEFIDKTVFQNSNRRKDLFKLTDIIRTKKLHGQDPVKGFEGLEQSVLERLITQSFQKRKYQPYGEDVADLNLISGKTIRDLLQQKQGKTTLEQDLLDSKVFTKDQVKSIKIMADKATELEKNILVREGIAPTEAEELIPKGDAIAEIIGRLGGVFAAQASPVVSGVGHELVVSAIFSRAGKDLMSRLPKDKLRKMLIESTRDPVLQRRLLQKVSTPKALNERNQYFLNAMVSKKILTERERYEIEDSMFGTESLKELQKNIKDYQKKNGLSKNQMMRAYEVAARSGKDNIGEFTLDMVQGILDIDDEERTRIRMSIPGRVVKKRSPQQRLQEKLQAR